MKAPALVFNRWLAQISLRAVNFSPPSFLGISSLRGCIQLFVFRDSYMDLNRYSQILIVFRSCFLTIRFYMLFILPDIDKASTEKGSAEMIIKLFQLLFTHECFF